MTNRERPNGNLAVLLCALSFATGLGLSERMEHGLAPDQRWEIEDMIAGRDFLSQNQS